MTPRLEVLTGEQEVRAFALVLDDDTPGTSYFAELSVVGSEGCALTITRERDAADPDQPGQRDPLLSLSVLRDDGWAAVRTLLQWALTERERIAPLARELNQAPPDAGGDDDA